MINYVIATWSGKDTKCDIPHTNNPPPQNTLTFHLERLSQLKHNLAKITIMKPTCDVANQMNNYYSISKIIPLFKCPVVVIECENYGYSNGQWLKCYEINVKNKEKFDYYIFIEDDYVPNQHHFDVVLMNLYNQKFPNLIGKLCGYVQGSFNNHKRKLPLHYESGIIVSLKTLELLYNTNNKWQGNPRSCLDKILIRNKRLQEKKRRTSGIGAFYQVNFSLLFTLLDIPILDFSKEYSVPYYEKALNKIYTLLHDHTSTECFANVSCHINQQSDQSGNYLIVPIQFYFLK